VQHLQNEISALNEKLNLDKEVDSRGRIKMLELWVGGLEAELEAQSVKFLQAFRLQTN
jgi:hypothetical protein